MEILAVAAGGALGSVLRYLLGNVAVRLWGDNLPYGTFLINICGCLCMGVLMTLIVERGALAPYWRLLLCVGFLGGFTTFSSFGYEAFTLLSEGRLLWAALYACGSTALGVIAAAVGFYLAR